MIEVILTGVEQGDGYRITVEKEIQRLLMTRKGSIPMSRYGSDLYLYRDRPLDGLTQLGIIAETFDAIETWVKRAVPKRVTFTSPTDGAFGLKIEVEVLNDAA